MNAQQFTPEEHADFTKAARYGRAYTVNLNDYQKARLEELAREKQYRAIQVHTERFARHSYTPQEPGQLDYWLNSSPDYLAAQQVLALLVELAPIASPAAKALPIVEVASAATVQPQKSNKLASREKEIASLRGLILEDVRELFRHPILQSEKDRAAALAILNTQNYLTGSPYKVAEWFAVTICAKVSRRLISDSIKEIREEGQVSEKAQQAAEWVTYWLKTKAK